MKVRINPPDSPCVNDRTYPYIGRTDRCGRSIVYFTERGKGVCLDSDSASDIGIYFTEWNEFQFYLMPGSVTLENN